MILSKEEIITPNGKDAWFDLPGLAVLIGGMWVANLYYWGFNQYIIQRTLAAKIFMLKHDMKQFGHLMNLSHLSYSQDFDASTKDVDLLTKRSIESGALGCRLTGGGFGGFTVSLIAKKNYEQWYNKMLKFYSKDKFFNV